MLGKHTPTGGNAGVGSECQTTTVDTRGSVTRYLAATAERIDHSVGWARLWTPAGLAVLVGLRSQLRAHNLVDTGRPGALLPPGERDDHRARTIDGTYNNLQSPRVGASGSLFGRNIPAEQTFPEPADQILEPNPRLISRRLLARDHFRPATTLNLLAAAWIQFEVHDWFSHAPSDADWTIDLSPDDNWSHGAMTFARTAPAPSSARGAPPTFATTVSHWWDGSQIYGETKEYAKAIRTRKGGKIRLDDDGLPPADTERLLDPEGQAANFWVGLALLHSLFLREHNAICDRLAAAYPHLKSDDQRLYDTARLINSALMAKIHTIDWTPAVIAHPTTVAAMRGNWFGLLGERIRRRYGRVTDNEVLCGIPGSPTEDSGVPFSLTEEFVAVYRMHPLIPDDVEIRTLGGNAVCPDTLVNKYAMADMLAGDVRTRLRERSRPDLLYSFGRANPGELTLHNFPLSMQNLPRPDGRTLDLGTVDIMRIRERGVPRYNEFRNLLRLPRVKTFDEMTDNPGWACELEQVYRDVDKVDLMIGLLAEPKPPGFGFSDTAFRIFVLMASRRLSCDRFFTTDFRPEVYTEMGMAWVRDNSMKSVLLRHHPTLAPALAGVSNPFAPWNIPTRPEKDSSR